MNLVNKINFRFFFLLVVVFTVAGVALYFAMGYVVNDNIDEILENRALKASQSLIRNPKEGSYGVSPDQSIEIDYISPRPSSRVFTDTTIYDPNDRESIECRKLTLTTKVNDRYYKIQIILSRLETEDLIQVVFYFMISLFGCIVIVLFFLNKRLSAGLWSPFFNTLSQLKNFKAGQKNEIVFEGCDVSEFSDLNSVLTDMISKIQSDFSNLKEFTENASHELQTPLAVIKTKLETVLQSKSLPGECHLQIQIAYHTVFRMSKLNEALLLLSKIENRQFPEESEINLSDLVSEKIADIEDMLSLRKISLTKNFNASFNIKMNLYLAEILINNLLSNAVRHNVDNGQIIISSSGEKITFSNTGQPLTTDPDKIFERFVRQTRAHESNGLGLSIAYEICKIYKLDLHYDNNNGMHNFILSGKCQV